MKKFLLCILHTALITTSSVAIAATDNDELTIVNHFNTTLQFTVGTNPATLPDVPPKFTLNQNQDIKTHVLKGKEAYIRVDGEERKSAFFGVNIENDKVRVHGYLGHGIAYSWTQNMVTFCTPDEYKQKRTCSRT